MVKVASEHGATGLKSAHRDVRATLKQGCSRRRSLALGVQWRRYLPPLHAWLEAKAKRVIPFALVGGILALLITGIPLSLIGGDRVYRAVRPGGVERSGDRQ